MLKKSILCGVQDLTLLKNETLKDIFCSTVQKNPSKIAIQFNDFQISYQQLDNWSNALANQLIANGFTNGKRIGVWHVRSIELHVAILSIVKAGATYVPIDYEMPKERVETVLLEAEAVAYFSDQKISLNVMQLSVLQMPTENIELTSISYSNASKAYILYTSGSTGKPKGIPISQKQICHFVRSENEVIKIQTTDIVYQGFSVSFDMWCEETWISFLVGATLIVADATTSKAIDELSDFLRKNKVTVLHAVPSLLAVIDDDIPSLRVINAGGEACTPSVLQTWAKGNRLFFNSYGPTETTVTSSIIALKPNDLITIGFPLPNYNYAVVDDNLNILPCGMEGELIITGPGVGEGYINLPELTAQKFVTKPLSEIELPGDKIYKTGDLATILENGTVEFHGRIDDQIKLRGYRIELGEIETQLSLQTGVQAAAVAIRKDSNDQEELVGYVKLNSLTEFNEGDLRASLTKVLAPYMIPAVILKLEEFPRLPSGKINRKLLPIPKSFEKQKESETKKIDLNASLKDRVIDTLSVVFPGKKIDLSMDFFTDLGGHSLLAATFVSKLRKDANIKNASLKDVYLNRPFSKLIEELEHNNEHQKEATEPFNKISSLRYWLCGLAQAVSLFFIYGLFAIQIFIPYLGYYYMQVEHESHVLSSVFALSLFCILPPILALFSLIIKWLVIGKYKEGHYPLWGTYYFRHWFVSTVQNLVPVNFLNGTPLYASYLRFRGMDVKQNTLLSSFSCGAEDLISIGTNTSISSGVVLNNVTIENGLLKISKISIGANCYIGTSAVISGNCKIHDWGELKDLSHLQFGKTINEAEIWKGSPANFISKPSITDLPQPLEVTKLTVFKYSVLYTFLLLIFPFAVLIPLIPSLFALYEFDDAAGDYEFYYLFCTPLLSFIYILVFAAQTIFFTKLLQRNITQGKYPVYSLFYVRKWLSDQFFSLSLVVMHPVYATVYISSYFRALGARIGKRTEISTASNVTPVLLTIKDESFIADAVTLGEADARAQQLILAETTIGNRTFVGNSALIPQGTVLGDGMLIGVLSIPPEADEMKTNDAKNWFGSPSIAMPQRQESQSFDNKLTFHPTKKTYAFRAIVEFIRIIIPHAFMLTSSWFFVAYIHDVLVDKPWWSFLLYIPVYYIGFISFPAFLFTVILKWVVVGKYKEIQMPMWSWGVWRSEAITSMFEALAAPFFLNYLVGTPFLPMMLRFFGVKIGKRVYMGTTDITEYDMVTIGDDVALNAECGPQTHLFEDRIMKIGSVKFGDRCSIGTRTIILYGSEIGKEVTVDPLSLIMKGEHLPNYTKWGGCPVRN